MHDFFTKIFNEHNGKVSDKWSLYINEWGQIFEKYLEKNINLLEIGIQNGGSLEIWSKYFSNAKKIVGCDIDKNCECLIYKDKRIKIIIGDANSDACESLILQQAKSFDIIIDDGSHVSSDVIRSFARYFPYLKDNGLYIIEDLHTSYWKDFEGGLYDPNSAMSFFKRITDILNFEHWRNDRTREYLLDAFERKLLIKFDERQLAKIHSIQFINSLCIIKKLPSEKNLLGKRKVVGTEECVASGMLEFDNSQIVDFPAIPNNDESDEIFELISTRDNLLRLNDKEVQTIQGLTAQAVERDQTIQALTAQVAEQDQTIQGLNSQIAERDQRIWVLNSLLQTISSELDQTKQELIGYALSKSWRFMRPFRKITQLIKGKKNA